MGRTNMWAVPRFWFVFAFLLWVAHAVGYLVHEYAHSFLAWALRYKANPVALNYGHLSMENLVFLSDIDENVDYGPIFAADKGYLASLIAVAGVLFGNGLCYLASRKLYSFAKGSERRTLALFCFLLCLMNVGNFISYVPVRTLPRMQICLPQREGSRSRPGGLPFCLACHSP
jgi:hypothetical protein